jgi:hypothetical protein
MTFEGQYLTYAEYQELGGSAIGLMPFNLLEFEARKRIDLRTHKRLIGQEIPNEVKLCIYNLINIISKYTSNYDRNLSSESVGSYSVTYANNISEVVKNKATELDDVILNDLYGVIVNNQHIIYNGV